MIIIILLKEWQALILDILLIKQCIRILKRLIRRIKALLPALIVACITRPVRAFVQNKIQKKYRCKKELNEPLRNVKNKKSSNFFDSSQKVAKGHSRNNKIIRDFKDSSNVSNVQKTKGKFI